MARKQREKERGLIDQQECAGGLTSGYKHDQWSILKTKIDDELVPVAR